MLHCTAKRDFNLKTTHTDTHRHTHSHRHTDIFTLLFALTLTHSQAKWASHAASAGFSQWNVWKGKGRITVGRCSRKDEDSSCRTIFICSQKRASLGSCYFYALNNINAQINLAKYDIEELDNLSSKLHNKKNETAIVLQEHKTLRCIDLYVHISNLSDYSVVSKAFSRLFGVVWLF